MEFAVLNSKSKLNYKKTLWMLKMKRMLRKIDILL